MGSFLTNAPDSSGRMVNIEDVENGIRCGCVCPHCGAPLCAKNGGKEREHHFAHVNGQECKGAYESSIHLLAKEVLTETRYISIPEASMKGFPSGSVVLRDVKAEKYDDTYGIKPDVEGIMTNGEKLLIEFNFTNKVNRKKRKIIIDNNLKCLEIDLKYQVLDKQKLRAFLVESTENRRWIGELPAKTSKGQGTSYSSGRKEIFFKTRDILKEVFEQNTLFINPFAFSPYENLKSLGYDVCEVGTDYNGFKCDLLLHRSNVGKKGYIAICVRGRRRYFCDKPDDLRVIDVVINSDLSEESVRNLLGDGHFKDGYAITFVYHGFEYANARRMGRIQYSIS